MNRNNQQAQILIVAVMEGSLGQVDCEMLLDKMQVRGSFDSVGYTGYDYKNQKWIRYDFT